MTAVAYLEAGPIRFHLAAVEGGLEVRLHFLANTD